jgi:hypothetical protein
MKDFSSRCVTHMKDTRRGAKEYAMTRHNVQLTTEQVELLESLLWQTMDDHHEWMFRLRDRCQSQTDAVSGSDSGDEHRPADTESDDFYKSLDRAKSQFGPDTQQEFTTRLKELDVFDQIFYVLDVSKRINQAAGLSSDPKASGERP